MECDLPRDTADKTIRPLLTCLLVVWLINYIDFCSKLVYHYVDYLVR